MRFASQMAGVEVRKGNALERGLCLRLSYALKERGQGSGSVLFFYRCVVAWERLELIEEDFQGVARVGHVYQSDLFFIVGRLFNIGSYRLGQKTKFASKEF